MKIIFNPGPKPGIIFNIELYGIAISDNHRYRRTREAFSNVPAGLTETCSFQIRQPRIRLIIDELIRRLGHNTWKSCYHFFRWNNLFNHEPFFFGVCFSSNIQIGVLHPAAPRCPPPPYLAHILDISYVSGSCV